MSECFTQSIEATMEPFEKLSAKPAARLGKKVVKKPPNKQTKNQTKHQVTVLKSHFDDVDDDESLLSARGMFFIAINLL